VMQANDKRVLSDSAITSKVKAQLLVTKGVPSASVSVETRVACSCRGSSKKEQATAAGNVAAANSGVRAVQNDLKVK